ncbi:hypothetical protein Tco_0711070 [Tanacetum coccineum]
MGEPLSPDRVFDFPVDEPEPHPAYDFFAPGPLPGYAGNPNNNNGWIEADVPLLGELGAVADEPMVGPLVDEIAEPIVEAEEQVIAPVVDMDEDIAMLFGDDDFEDDDSEGFDEEEVWEVNEEWLMAPVIPPPMPAVPPLSVYEVGGPSTIAAEGQSFPHPASGLPVPPSVSDAEVAAGITIRDISPRISAVEGQVQVMASQMVYVADRFEQVGTQALQAAVQQRDSQIQQLQTMVLEMSSRESTLMQCILGMDRRLVELERRPPGPQDSQGGWKLRWLVPRLKVRNGEDFSYLRCVLPLMYQLMVVKRTSFPEMESSGTDSANITRKWPKLDKHGHGNGKSAQEPEVSNKRFSSSEAAEYCQNAEVDPLFILVPSQLSRNSDGGNGCKDRKMFLKGSCFSGYESEDSSGNEVNLDSADSASNNDDSEDEGSKKEVNDIRSSAENHSEMVNTENTDAANGGMASDVLDCVLKSKSVFKCRLCPRIVCLTEESLKAHLTSKRHARSEKLLKEGRLKKMLNSDGEIEDGEDGETHQERHAKILALAESNKNAKKNKGRQRQKKRKALKKVQYYVTY